MKKNLVFLMLVCILINATGCSFAQNANIDDEKTFTILKIPFPDDIKDNDSWRTVARYKDSKQAIALSSFYNGYIYATVPTEDKDREIEAFVPDEIKFTDYDASQYEFHVMERLSKTGVILGNEKGEAKPFDNVTRAEATSMIMRFLGLHTLTSYELKFDDVHINDWFYGYVAAAHKNNIIVGDTNNVFSPHRNVTREEITVMVSRALKYAKLQCPKRREENISDIHSVSEWAKEAYELIGTSYISDYNDTNPDRPVRVLNPQKYATRFDIASFLDNIALTSQLYPSDLAVKYGFDKQMPRIDGSTSTYPFTEVIYSQLFYNGWSHKQYPQKHSKSHESYKRLINGEVDMIFASVYPSSDIIGFAKEKKVELELIPIAYDAMIFFTNATNPANGITKDDITNIYVNDSYKNWNEIGGENALLYPYCRNNDSGSHAQMEKHFLKGNEIHPEVKKETSMTMSNILTDVIDAKTDNPKGYGLGYSIYYYFHNVDSVLGTKAHLKLLAIDGVMPTDETIANGTYPLSNNTYIVIRKDTPKDSPARKMAEFMLTEEGQECVELAGYGKLK